MASPVFEAMFKEIVDGGECVGEVAILDDRPCELRNLVSKLYKNNIHSSCQSVHEALQLYRLSHKYQIDTITSAMSQVGGVRQREGSIYRYQCTHN